jgi:hypothetical protein
LQRRMATKVIASSIRSFVCIVLDLLQGPALQLAFLVRGEALSAQVSLACPLQPIGTSGAGILSVKRRYRDTSLAPKYRDQTPAQTEPWSPNLVASHFPFHPFSLLLSIALMSFFFPLASSPASHSFIQRQPTPDQLHRTRETKRSNERKVAVANKLRSSSNRVSPTLHYCTC